MNKAALSEASLKLQEAWDEIVKIADGNPSIMVYYKDEFGESFAAFVSTADDRIAHIRKQLVKYGEKLPKGKRRSKKDG